MFPLNVTTIDVRLGYMNNNHYVLLANTCIKAAKSAALSATSLNLPRKPGGGKKRKIPFNQGHSSTQSTLSCKRTAFQPVVLFISKVRVRVRVRVRGRAVVSVVVRSRVRLRALVRVRAECKANGYYVKVP